MLESINKIKLLGLEDIKLFICNMKSITTEPHWKHIWWKFSFKIGEYLRYIISSDVQV